MTLAALSSAAMEAVSQTLLAAEAAERVGSGRIVGGWEYVWASYAIAWGGIALYALSLFVRRPKASSLSSSLSSSSKESP